MCSSPFTSLLTRVAGLCSAAGGLISPVQSLSEPVLAWIRRGARRAEPVRAEPWPREPALEGAAQRSAPPLLLSSWYFRAISYKALSVRAAENALGSALALCCSRGWNEQGSSLPAPSLCCVLQCLGLCWRRAGLQAESSETENPTAAALSAQGAPRQSSDQGDELFPGMVRAYRSWQGCWKAHGVGPGGWGGLGATPPAPFQRCHHVPPEGHPAPAH